MGLIPGLSSIQKYYLPADILVFLKKELLAFGGVIVDAWSIAHLLSGWLLAMFVQSRLLAILLLVGFEAFEYVLFAQGLAIPETLVNQGFDVLVGYVGFELGRRRF